MPFGLINTLVMFQAIINYILRKYLDIFVITYLDNIFIYLKILKNHKKYMYKVLQMLQDAKLLVKLEKSKFYT